MENIKLQFVFVLLLIALSSPIVSKVAKFRTKDGLKALMKDKILNTYLDKPIKELFKVWHTLSNQKYDYNTIEGINRYKNFKNTVSQIKKHNSGNHSWKMGLNDFSDLTDDEFVQHFNLNRELDIKKEVKEGIKIGGKSKFISLDNYDEENEKNLNSSDKTKTNVKDSYEFTSINHKDLDNGVRDQGKCGSCWAFSTLAAMELNWNKIYNAKPSSDSWLSVQYSMDCDTLNKSCGGGWYNDALKFYSSKTAFYEWSYEYQEIEQKCGTPDSLGKTNVGIKYYKERQGQEDIHTILKEGSVGVGCKTNSAWKNYKSGIFNEPNEGKMSHAITLVGYGLDADDWDDDDWDDDEWDNSEWWWSPKSKRSKKSKQTGKLKFGDDGYWIAKNSWGTSWGEQGFIKIRRDAENNHSMQVDLYGYLPIMK